MTPGEEAQQQSARLLSAATTERDELHEECCRLTQRVQQQAMHIDTLQQEEEQLSRWVRGRGL